MLPTSFKWNTFQYNGFHSNLKVSFHSNGKLSMKIERFLFLFKRKVPNNKSDYRVIKPVATFI